MRLEVVHETTYAYGAPVSLAHHLAHLRPLSDPHQRLLSHTVTFDPRPDACREARDVFGNGVLWFSRAQAHDHLRVCATSLVDVQPRHAGLDADASPPWDGVAARLCYVAAAPYDPAVEFVQPSPYVPRLAELRDWAAPMFPAGRPVVEAALALMHCLHADFEYRSASTQVDTPLAEAFAQRRGVCQDFAHLMAGALRMLGVPARYVSGYLLTCASGDGAPMLGADASHAWVQLYCPGTPGVPADGWLDLDPTNNVVPADGHVRVAVGRDFGDVTPLRGVIRGGGRHRLSVAVQTWVVDAPAGPIVASLCGEELP